jgi:hypothetical protein
MSNNFGHTENEWGLKKKKKKKIIEVYDVSENN